MVSFTRLQCEEVPGAIADETGMSNVRAQKCERQCLNPWAERLLWACLANF